MKFLRQYAEEIVALVSVPARYLEGRPTGDVIPVGSNLQY